MAKSSASFKPGQSGNPGGRDKVPDDVKALLRNNAPQAVKRLIHWQNQDENPMASIAAAKDLADRALGKPVQAVVATTESELAAISDEQLATLIDTAERIANGELAAGAAYRTGKAEGGKPGKGLPPIH